MKRLFIYSAIMSCFMGNLVQAQTIHTLGKPIVQSKSAGYLDLRELIKPNPHLVFAVKNPKSGEISYTRDGIFYNKNDGYYYQGQLRLQGYPISKELTETDCKLTDVKSPSEELSPVATTYLQYAGNLDAADSLPVVKEFNPDNSNSFNFSMGTTIYDSLGEKHTLTVYFLKDQYNAWNTNIYVDGHPIGSGHLLFSTSGALIQTTGMSSLNFNPGNGAASQLITLSFSSGFTQVSGPYMGGSPVQDGMAEGVYAYQEVDESGYISFSYSNGKSITFSKVAAFFR